MDRDQEVRLHTLYEKLCSLPEAKQRNIWRHIQREGLQGWLARPKWSRSDKAKIRNLIALARDRPGDAEALDDVIRLVEARLRGIAICAGGPGPTSPMPEAERPTLRRVK